MKSLTPPIVLQSPCRRIAFLIAPLVAFACLILTPASYAAITLTQNSSTSWTATNGIVTFTMNPTNFSITALTTIINGTTTNWLDASFGNSPFNHAIGLYNIYGYAFNGTQGTITASYHLTGDYLDIWVDKPHLVSSDPLDVENHWVLFANDPAIHFYQVLRHTSSDGATNFGAATTNFFPSSNAITQSDGTLLQYSKNTGPNNMGTILETFPAVSYTTNLLASNPGRQVQGETVDYTSTTTGTHLSTPGLAREFISKYNYGTYIQYHTAHGYVGATNAFWWVIPSNESLNGGPTKQILTGVQVEYQSAHLGGTNIAFAAGEVATHVYGPFALRFNAFDGVKSTADDLYNDAANSVPTYLALYDAESILTGAGYRKQSDRVSVTVNLGSAAMSSTSSQNVVALTDSGKFMEESANGYQYWGYADSTGKAVISGVRPGNYRVSAYNLGTNWGLYHIDNVAVGTANITVNGNFQPRNFSTQSPVWKIGYPDRSAHEYSHGHSSNGFDIKDYLGSYNYWKDLETNSGKLIYTLGTSYTGNWPFTQFGAYYPSLYAGVYGGSTSGKNGYDYITPSYVVAGASNEGKTPANYVPPPWELHFTATAAQMAQGNYVIVSVNLAGNDHSSISMQLNGKHLEALKWFPRLGSDPEQRSGVSGYNNYGVFQFNTADLNAAGNDNIITLFASGSTMYDALKLEISSHSADPAITGWPEYDWTYYDGSDATVTQAATAP